MPDFTTALSVPMPAPAAPPAEWTPHQGALETDDAQAFRHELARADRQDARAPERRGAPESRGANERLPAEAAVRGDEASQTPVPPEQTSSAGEIDCDEGSCPPDAAPPIRRDPAIDPDKPSAPEIPAASELSPVIDRPTASETKPLAPDVALFALPQVPMQPVLTTPSGAQPPLPHSLASTTPANSNRESADAASPAPANSLPSAAAPGAPSGMRSGASVSPASVAHAENIVPGTVVPGLSAVPPPVPTNAPLSMPSGLQGDTGAQPAGTTNSAAAATPVETTLPPAATATPEVPVAIGAGAQAFLQPGERAADFANERAGEPGVPQSPAAKAAGTTAALAAMTILDQKDIAAPPGAPRIPAVPDSSAPAPAGSAANLSTSKAGAAGFKAELAARADTAPTPVSAPPSAPGVASLQHPSAPNRPAMVQAQTNPARIPAEALAYEITRHQANGVNRFEIRLDPPELGRIEVRLEVANDGSTRAHLSADRADTLDLLQRDARGLERALNAAGLKTERDGIAFSLRQDGAEAGLGREAREGNRNSAGGSTFVSFAEDEEPSAPAAAQPAGRYSTMRINIVI